MDFFLVVTKWLSTSVTPWLLAKCRNWWIAHSCSRWRSPISFSRCAFFSCLFTLPNLSWRSDISPFVELTGAYKVTKMDSWRPEQELFLCYHCKRVLTKKTLDIRNFVPSSLFTQKKLVLTKKGHLIFVISNVFVLLVNRSLVLSTFWTCVFYLRIVFLGKNKWTTGNGWSQNRLLMSGTRVFSPLLVFPRQIFLQRSDISLVVTTGDDTRLVPNKVTHDIRTSCLL
jgi:hypothetical protein